MRILLIYRRVACIPDQLCGGRHEGEAVLKAEAVLGVSLSAANRDALQLLEQLMREITPESLRSLTHTELIILTQWAYEVGGRTKMMSSVFMRPSDSGHLTRQLLQQLHATPAGCAE